MPAGTRAEMKLRVCMHRVNENKAVPVAMALPNNSYFLKSPSIQGLFFAPNAALQGVNSAGRPVARLCNGLFSNK